ncbi:MAG: aldolase/citrate lyase family protein, partial [Pseudomonadota bacterium]
MRSLLFVPGDSERKLDKCATSGADILIVDLEDSVTQPRKSVARTLMSQWLQSRSVPRERTCVRVNPRDTQAHDDDLDALIAHPPAIVMLPKARGGEDVAGLHDALRRRGLDSVKILPLVTEVPQSVLRLDSYAEKKS